MTISIADLPEIDINSPEFQADAVAVTESARESVGFARSARGVEVLSYSGLSGLLRDTRFNGPQKARLNAIGIFDGPAYDLMLGAMVNIEGDGHRRQRQASAPWFKTQRAEGMRQTIRSWVDEWIGDHLASGHLNFKDVISRPLPSALFCHVVGAPLGDREELVALTEVVVQLAANPTPAQSKGITTAAETLIGYVRNLVAAKRREPDDGLVSVLIAASDSGMIDEDEIVNIVFTVLVAGVDTTNAQMCANLVTLADNPGHWRELKAKPELVPSAILEMSRYHPSLMSLTVRKTAEDLVLDDVQFGPDIEVWACWFSAAKDSKAYPDPHRLDFRRSFSNVPLAFGFGIHSCLGRAFAVMQMEEVLHSFLAHVDEFSVTAESVGFPALLVPTRLDVDFSTV